MADQVLSGIQNNLSQVTDLQLQLSSGKKFQKVSENPVDMARVMRIQQQINKDTQYTKNLDNLKPNLQMTDSNLQDIVNRMQSVQQLAIQYQNVAVQSNSNELMSTNMDTLLNNIIDLANGSYNGRYIFGGYNTATKPFELQADGRIKYSGTDDVLKAQVTDSESIDLSISGNDLFTTHSVLGNQGLGSKTVPIAGLTTNTFSIKVGTDPAINITVGAGPADVTLQATVDAINNSGAEVKAYIKDTPQGARLKIVSNYVGKDGQMVLTDGAVGGVLEHLGLIDNTGTIVGPQSDPTAGLLDTMVSMSRKMKAGTIDISAEVKDLSTAYQNVLKHQGRIAILTQNADNRSSMMTDMELKRQELMSSVWDVDMVKVTADLSRETAAYQASIQAGARIVMPTLLDYLK
jgi:flagellar hook-associated protein 3 FlgL